MTDELVGMDLVTDRILEASMNLRWAIDTLEFECEKSEQNDAMLDKLDKTLLDLLDILEGKSA